MGKKTQEELITDIQKYHIDRNPITIRQLKLELLDRGLLKKVPEAINALKNDELEIIEIEWENADLINRSDDWINKICKNLDMTSKDIDDLFYEALKR